MKLENHAMGTQCAPASLVRFIRTSSARRSHYRVRTLVALLIASSAYSRPASSQQSYSAATNIQVSEILQLADLSGVTISPDGKIAAVRVERPSVAANRVEMRWHFVSLKDGRDIGSVAGGEPNWLPSGNYEKVRPKWSRNSLCIFVRARIGGSVNLFKGCTDGTLTQITRSTSNVEKYVLDETNNRILYQLDVDRSTLLKAKEAELLRGVIADGTQYLDSPLHDNMPYGGGPATIRMISDGKSHRWMRLGDDGQRTLHVVRLDTLETQLASDEDTQSFDLAQREQTLHSMGNPAPRSRSKAGALASLADPNFLTIIREARQTSPKLKFFQRAVESVHCKSALCTNITDEVVWRPGTERLIFTSSDLFRSPSTGIARLLEFDYRSKKVRVIAQVGGALGRDSGTYSGQCPLNIRVAVCVIEDENDPPRLITIDLHSGKSLELFDPNEALRKRIRRFKVEHLSWTDYRGLTHTGVLVHPALKSTVPPPLVITSYVCSGFLRGGTGGTVPEFVLADRGFAVLCTSGDISQNAPIYHDRSIPPGKATMMQYMLDGWESAVTTVARQNLADPRKVGISGLSFTGGVVSYALTRSAIASAATSGHLGSLTDPSSYFLLSGKGKFGEAVSVGSGLVSPNTADAASYYNAASPALNATNVSAPLLVQTGDAEYIGGLEFYGALRANRKPVELILYPSEAHLFWQPAHRLIMMQRNIDWFQYWLKDVRSDMPADPQQYRRWDAIRRP